MQGIFLDELFALPSFSTPPGFPAMAEFDVIEPEDIGEQDPGS